VIERRTALFRELKQCEKEILERLLMPEFPGAHELRGQLELLKAKEIDDDGGLELQTARDTIAHVKWRVPTEAVCEDSDGGKIHILLHVLQGRMCELELYREDAKRVLRFPRASDIELFAPIGEEGKQWKGKTAKVTSLGASGPADEAGSPTLDPPLK
jgi:hypothetical protein